MRDFGSFHAFSDSIIPCLLSIIIYPTSLPFELRSLIECHLFSFSYDSADKRISSPNFIWGVVEHFWTRSFIFSDEFSLSESERLYFVSLETNDVAFARCGISFCGFLKQCCFNSSALCIYCSIFDCRLIFLEFDLSFFNKGSQYCRASP